MKSVSTSPDLAQQLHDLAVAYPYESMFVGALALGLAIWVWDNIIFP